MLVGYGNLLPLVGFLTGLFLWSLFVDDYHFTLTSGPKEVQFQNAGPPVWPAWSNINNMFVFGDAMSDTHFSPYGSQPTIEVPFGNSDRIKSEASAFEYYSWINHLQADHGASRLLVYNLARWNATLEKYAYYPHKNGQSVEYNSVTFDEQVVQFQVTYTASYHWPDIAAPWTGRDSLFVIWFGSDDIADNVDRSLPLPINPLFASFMASLEQLYMFGARNFLILNAPPTNRINPDPLHFVRDDIGLYNQRILNVRKKMLERHSDAHMMVFDVNTLLTQALEDPSRFPRTRGITNVTDACDFPIDDAGCKGHFWRSRRNVTEPVMDLIAANVANDCLRHDKPVGYCSDGLR